MEEEWRPVKGYEGLYEVSNMGRVKSLHASQEIILKQGEYPNGYMGANLSKDGTANMKLVHRLVAIAFIQNPNNYEEVNHKDGNKKNNTVDNLEWCTRSYVIERLGSYLTTWNNGLHFKIPFVDRVSNKVSLKEIVKDFAPRPVITKDNVTMQIDTVVYFQITDPKLYTYGIEDPINAIENLTATTLRNIIGELELDQTLTSRDIINSKMRSILDEATDPWGIKVNRVEVKNILPPRDIQEAMEKQMRAERERREKILQAEGEKKSCAPFFQQ